MSAFAKTIGESFYCLIHCSNEQQLSPTTTCLVNFNGWLFRSVLCPQLLSELNVFLMPTLRTVRASGLNFYFFLRHFGGPHVFVSRKQRVKESVCKYKVEAELWLIFSFCTTSADHIAGWCATVGMRRCLGWVYVRKCCNIWVMSMKEG